MLVHPLRLSQLIWAAALASAAVTGIVILRGNRISVGPLLGTLGLLLLAQWLLHQGRPQRAAALTVGTLTLSVSYLLFLNQGIHGQAVSAIPAILLITSMVGRRRLYLTVIAVLFTVLTAIAVSNLQGWHVNEVQPVSAALLLILLVIQLLSAFCVWTIAGDLRNTLARLGAENERLRASYARIDALAHHDALTGLPNRVLVRDRFEQTLAMVRRDQGGVALIFLDLDNFKAINDSLGHATGDLLLCEVAKRIVPAVRGTDTVSRQGGDEFLIVMGGAIDQQSVATTAAQIIERLSAPFCIHGLDISVTCSLGISMFPEDGKDFDTLLKNADVAMYRAKDEGRNALRFYDREMNSSVVETLHLISGMRSALGKGEFELHYQPQYELRTGRIVGAEARLRWPNPELGPVAPAKFIPVAERSGLINELGAWVIKEACRRARQWQDAGLGPLVVAINVSPVQFRGDDFERALLQALAAEDLAPSCMELELTESLFLGESSRLTALLGRLRALGVRFSIDDFGTGYSNLGYLKRFAVERLKIDRSFIHRLTQNANDEGIVRAIIEMARSLKLGVIAEGVEDLPTLKRLIELGCEFGQGFYWSPALPPEQFVSFVREHRAP